MPASIAIWFLASYPTKASGIAQTYAGKVGGVIEPLLKPIGFNLEIAISLIPAMAAREVAVSSLATIYALQDTQTDALSGIISASWTLSTALAFLAWFVLRRNASRPLRLSRKRRMAGSGRSLPLAISLCWLTWRRV